MPSHRPYNTQEDRAIVEYAFEGDERLARISSRTLFEEMIEQHECLRDRTHDGLRFRLTRIMEKPKKHLYLFGSVVARARFLQACMEMASDAQNGNGRKRKRPQCEIDDENRKIVAWMVEDEHYRRYDIETMCKLLSAAMFQSRITAETVRSRWYQSIKPRLAMLSPVLAEFELEKKERGKFVGLSDPFTEPGASIPDSLEATPPPTNVRKRHRRLIIETSDSESESRRPVSKANPITEFGEDAKRQASNGYRDGRVARANDNASGPSGTSRFATKPEKRVRVWSPFRSDSDSSPRMPVAKSNALNLDEGTSGQASNAYGDGRGAHAKDDIPAPSLTTRLISSANAQQQHAAQKNDSTEADNAEVQEESYREKRESLDGEPARLSFAQAFQRQSFLRRTAHGPDYESNMERRRVRDRQVSQYFASRRSRAFKSAQDGSK